MESIKILVTLDENYLQPLRVLLTSLVVNNPSEEIDVWQFTAPYGYARSAVCKNIAKNCTLINDLSEFSKLKAGDILVCKYTDPVWTPLFTLAKAVVSDTGGPLSHSAIVAREYNIPAVLGCGNATQLLQDGQEILVDGDKGIVSIL